MFMRDTDVAIRRTEAAIHALAVRMQNAVGDLDYETYLHEKRTLTAALLALRNRRAQEERDTVPSNFSQNSVSSDRIKTNSQ